MLAAAPVLLMGLVLALSDLGQNRAHRHGTLFASHTHGHLHELLVVTEDTVLRIGREALLNAFRHLHARRIDLASPAAEDGHHMTTRSSTPWAARLRRRLARRIHRTYREEKSS